MVCVMTAVFLILAKVQTMTDTLILPSRSEYLQQCVDKDIKQLRGRDASLRYNCIKDDDSIFCVICSQTDCCTVVNLLLQQINIWYTKHVHNVPESCLWHCITGSSEVDIRSIDSLSLSVGLM